MSNFTASRWTVRSPGFSTWSPAKPGRREFAPGSNLDRRRLINFVDGPLKNRIERFVIHRYLEFVDQSPREAGDHAVVSGEACAGLGPCVAAGEGHHPDYPRVFYQLRIKIWNVRNR